MIPGLFHSIAEVDAWLNCERVLCLICARTFEHLGRHIACAHRMTADEFREVFGIPHNRGLVGARLKDRFVARQILEMARNAEHRRKFVDAVTRKPYSVHRPSATQLAELRTRVQPMGNRARWGNV
jgi:ROS/MUCR transcriptional regulator protein